MKDLHLLKNTDVFLNYPDHKSLDNVLDVVYDNYYKDWTHQYIIDRGPVMTPDNFALMQKHFKQPFKCIVLVRDLLDVLASFMKWYTENPDAFPNRYNCKNDEEKLSMLMNKEGGIAKELEAIKNAYNYPQICHFVKYDDLVTQPQEEIKKIGYDDRIVGKNMHVIRTVLRKEYNSYRDKLPERIEQKYGHIKF